MRTKNHIKAKNNSLRGIGKLGWTEGGIVFNTIKRLVATFPDKDQKSSGSFKTRVKCPGCGRKFNLNNPNHIPDHKPRWYSSYYDFGTGYCTQGRGRFNDATPVKEISDVVIAFETFKPKDKVIISPYPFQDSFNVGRTDLIASKIEKIYLMSNDKISIKFEGYEKLMPVYYFHKNIIKY